MAIRDRIDLAGAMFGCALPHLGGILPEIRPFMPALLRQATRLSTRASSTCCPSPLRARWRGADRMPTAACVGDFAPDHRLDDLVARHVPRRRCQDGPHRGHVIRGGISGVLRAIRESSAERRKEDPHRLPRCRLRGAQGPERRPDRRGPVSSARADLAGADQHHARGAGAETSIPDDPAHRAVPDHHPRKHLARKHLGPGLRRRGCPGQAALPMPDWPPAAKTALAARFTPFRPMARDGCPGRPDGRSHARRRSRAAPGSCSRCRGRCASCRTSPAPRPAPAAHGRP